jgi:hypothetical protein
MLAPSFSPFLKKGPWNEIFDLCFFHQKTSPGSLTHRLKPFRIWLWICEDNRQSLLHSGVMDTAVTGTAVSMTPLCNQQRIFSRIIVIRKSALAAHGTAVSLTQLWFAQRCQWHCCDFISHIWDALFTFKGNIYSKNMHRQIVMHYVPITSTHKIWGLTRDCLFKKALTRVSRA